MSRTKRLRYEGATMRRFRAERKFQYWMDRFAKKCRERMAAQEVNAWAGLLPNSPPSGMGSVLTKGVLDAAADRLGVPHP